MRQMILLFILGLHGLGSSAAVFDRPEGGDSVIGHIVSTIATEEDTLLDIARRYGLGYQDIQLANRQLNMWLPGKDRGVVLPTKYVLPMAPRKGIVLNIPEMRLYYYPPDGSGKEDRIYTYPLGIGREGWSTPYVNTRVIEKKEKPHWYPPESIREEYAENGNPLPGRVPPGPENPLGDYAMRLGIPAYLIHGTNQPYGIGLRVSHGCIRLYPEDIEELYQTVSRGTPVHIVNQPYKLGIYEGRFYLEAHPFLDEDSEQFKENLTSVVRMLVKLTGDQEYDIDWSLAKEVIRDAKGVPVKIGRLKTSPVMAEREKADDEKDREPSVRLKLETGLSTN